MTRLIQILRGPESLSIILRESAPHPILPDALVHVYTAIASFPLGYPACIDAVAEAYSSVLGGVRCEWV